MISRYDIRMIRTYVCSSKVFANGSFGKRVLVDIDDSNPLLQHLLGSRLQGVSLRCITSKDEPSVNCLENARKERYRSV